MTTSPSPASRSTLDDGRAFARKFIIGFAIIEAAAIAAALLLR